MIVTATQGAQKDNIFVIYSQSFQGEPEIHGYALSRDEAISFCASHGARFPYAPRYVFREIGRIYDK